MLAMAPCVTHILDYFAPHFSYMTFFRCVAVARLAFAMMVQVLVAVLAHVEEMMRVCFPKFVSSGVGDAMYM